MIFEKSRSALRVAISVPLFLVVAAGCTSPDRAFGDGSSGASSGASGSSGSGGSAGSSGSAGSAGSGGSAGSSGSAGSGGTGGSGGASGSSGSAGSGGTGGSSGSAGSSGSGGTGAVSGSAGSGGGTLAIGEVCGNSGDCAQGNCVDGVCCDSACTGSCESCIQIHTGVANGMCAPAIPGAPPHPGCNDEGASSCGHNGVCDGAGNCDFYPVGTTCGAQSCSGGQVTPPPTCDGGGSCVPSSPITCSPNPVCAGNACQGACTGDGDCNGTQYCDLSAGGTCKSKLPNGTSCSTAAANQCSSGLCVDGVCCGSACDTACKTCRAPGSEGSCVALTSADDASPSGICAGSFTCDGSGICRKKNGETCGGSSDCVSGFCVDGVCCNAACTDACRTCAGSGSLGVCSTITNAQDNVPAGICSGANSCDGGGTCRKTNGQVCGAGGECLSGNCVDGFCCDTSCGADCYSCNVTGSIGTCSPVAAGVTDGACVSPGSCSGAGDCKQPQGSTCSSASQCTTGFCVDGFCCNTACTGLCRSCSGAYTVGATDGVCDVIDCLDPNNECAGSYVCVAGTCKSANQCLL